MIVIVEYKGKPDYAFEDEVRKLAKRPDTGTGYNFATRVRDITFEFAQHVPHKMPQFPRGDACCHRRARGKPKLHRCLPSKGAWRLLDNAQLLRNRSGKQFGRRTAAMTTTMTPDETCTCEPNEVDIECHVHGCDCNSVAAHVLDRELRLDRCRLNRRYLELGMQS